MMKAKTIEIHSLRWYIEPLTCKLYPSVSTINGWKQKLFGKYWRVGDAANAGTGIHYQIQKYIFDKYGVGDKDDLKWPLIDIWNMTEEERRRKLNSSMMMWFSFLKDNPDFRPIKQELSLFSHEKMYAGRIDQYNEIKDELVLLDVKTGGYWPDYDFQSAGYYQVMVENGYKIDKLMLLFLDAHLERNPEQKYKIKVYSMEEIKQNVEGFNERVREYYIQKPDVYSMTQMYENKEYSI